MRQKRCLKHKEKKVKQKQKDLEDVKLKEDESAMDVDFEITRSTRKRKLSVSSTKKETSSCTKPKEYSLDPNPEGGPCPSRRPKPKPRRPRYYDCPVCGDDLEGKTTIQCQSCSLITCEMCHWSRYGQCAYCVEATSDGSGAEDQENVRDLMQQTSEYVLPKDKVLRQRKVLRKKG